LVRLVGCQSGEGNIILDPFCGSGTTGAACALEGFEFVGIDQDASYVAVARQRIAWWAAQPEGITVELALAAEAVRRGVAGSGQGAFDF
jgi:site-specific DNA-methyltransferase (adenine-specific)